MSKRKDTIKRDENKETVKQARKYDEHTNESKIGIPKVFKDSAVFSSDSGSVNDDEENDHLTESEADNDLPELLYYRGDKKLPVYSNTSPDLKSIFRICLKKDVPANRMTETKPTRISSTSTFIVDQKLANLKHPYDVDADETPGAYEKKEQTRFYEVKVGDEGNLLVSSEVTVNKDDNGNIAGGIYNVRDGRNWIQQVASKKHL